MGSKVEPFTAKDQHDNAFTFKPAETRFLLVSHDMETGKKANAALNALGKDYLGIEKSRLHGQHPRHARHRPDVRHAEDEKIHPPHHPRR